MVDGAAFADVEGVTEGGAVPVSDLHLQLCPDAAIEIVELWLHITVEEGLLVGFLGVPSVGAGTDVSSGGISIFYHF